MAAARPVLLSSSGRTTVVSFRLCFHLLVAVVLFWIYLTRRFVHQIQQTREQEESAQKPIVMSSKGFFVATRLHLGQSTSPPTDLDEKIRKFADFCEQLPNCSHVVVAVDATDKIPGFSLVEDLRRAIGSRDIDVLPVTPWGKFTPALNALIRWGVEHNHQFVLFTSLEVQATPQAVSALFTALDDGDTLVAGARLAGHDYQPGVRVLTGRTTPWNTLAVWDLRRLALTGFQLVSEGHFNNNKMAGVEEVVAIGLLQRILGDESAKAKVVQVPGIAWEQQFDDPGRREWHEHKMQSKVERPAYQLELTQLSGVVHHC